MMSKAQAELIRAAGGGGGRAMSRSLARSWQIITDVGVLAVVSALVIAAAPATPGAAANASPPVATTSAAPPMPNAAHFAQLRGLSTLRASSNASITSVPCWIIWFTKDF